MEWWLIGGLCLVVITLISIYRRSLRENRALVHYTIILLLHEGIYNDHRKKMSQYVDTVEAKNAFDLCSKVYIATGNMAAQMKDSMALAAGLLWDLKTGQSRVANVVKGANG